MLEEYAKLHGFTNVIHYTDDGYSGTNFERPDFKRMINDIEHNLIDTVIVKDLSRLGRDYLKTGYFLEEFFPKYKVRFISLNDDIDSNEGIPELTPFKNIMNEWYAKEISRKIRSAYKTKALKGEKLVIFLIMLTICLTPLLHVITASNLSQTNIEVEKLKSNIEN